MTEPDINDPELLQALRRCEAKTNSPVSVALNRLAEISPRELLSPAVSDEQLELIQRINGLMGWGLVLATSDEACRRVREGTAIVLSLEKARQIADRLEADGGSRST